MTGERAALEPPEEKGGENGAGVPDALEATPVMAQWLEAKRAHPDSLLFFRMGDFYELFFEDAAVAAAALDIALTKRGKDRGQDIPMCGVPAHSHEAYLHRLIAKGHKVAICEQLEDPAEARKRGVRALVKREVVRVVTPGTLTEETLLDARRANYLAALARAEGRYALAWLDVSTGAFAVEPLEAALLGAALARLEPGEILISDALLKEPALFDLLAEWKARLTPQAASLFDSRPAGERLKAFYRVAALDAFGDFGRAETAACGALLGYVELTQRGRLPYLGPPRVVSEGALLAIDPATRRNLELTESLSGARAGSLLDVIDRTVTGAGGRLMHARLAQPLTDVSAINDRLDAVGYFVARPRLREQIRAQLKKVPDIERALSRLTLSRGLPRDLAAIRDGLGRVPELRRLIALRERAEAALEPLPASLALADKGLGHHATLVDRLSAALFPEPPATAREGGFIAKGYSAELDEFRTLRDEGRRLIAALEARYRQESGIASLKIRHNNVLGYFIEVPPGQAAKMGASFVHRQTLASAVRYASVELSELEDKIGRAAASALALELALFDDLVGEVAARAAEIATAAGAMAELDVFAALAELAAARNYVRPVVDASAAFRIEGGRHPVVEALAPGRPFVANDCDLSEASRLWLLTGPNMAGKSTFLRQNALIALLAQAGSFVPAEAARIGVIDKLFSRVGASDDLARGRSTFMVEMIETAAILHQAGPRSLVILDEIGRGTATFDGLSIAWATVEHLHTENRCRTLFATHFHELTLLAQKLPALACRTMRVKEWKGEVVFLHEVVAGVADRSYGIHVAKLAGLPPPVLARAEEVLKTLEEGETGGAAARLAHDLPLFAAQPSKTPAPSPASAIEDELRALDADSLTPRTALELIYRLKARLASE